MSICALLSGAQTLTRTYIEYADSVDRYIKHERWEDAERVIIAALRLEPANPSNFLLWSNLGTVRERMGRHDEAIQAFDIGLASAPKSTTLLSNRAYSLMAAGREDEALADLDKALEVDSTLYAPLLARGEIMLARKNLEKASADFSRAARLHPRQPGSHERLGDTEMIRGDKSKAAELYGEELKIGKSEELWFKKILAEIEAGHTERAEEDMHEAIGAYPRSGSLHLLRGVLLKLKFLNTESEIERKIALEYGADPELVDAMLPLQKK